MSRLCCREQQLDPDSLNFLPIAGSGLQKLNGGALGSSIVIDLLAAGGYTNLTELRLEYYYCNVDFGPLRNLGLQKLSLIDCPGAELILFGPGTLTALTSLYMWERKSDLENFGDELMGRAAPPLYCQSLKEDLLEIRETLLSHPSLVEVSGQSRLYMLEVFCEQTGWTEGFASGCGASESCFCSICTVGIYQKWRKA